MVIVANMIAQVFAAIREEHVQQEQIYNIVERLTAPTFAMMMVLVKRLVTSIFVQIEMRNLRFVAIHNEFHL